MRIFSLLFVLLSYGCFGQNDALEKAKMLYDEANYAQAISVLEMVLEEDQESFEAHLLRGNCFQKEERFVAAIQSYEIADGLNRESAILNANFGAAFLNLNQLEEAKKKLKTALRLDNQLPEAYYFMGNLEYFEFNTNSALKNYDKAIELRPDYRDALYMKAAANAELGNYALAMDDYQKVLELDPNLEVAKYNMAVLLISNEQYEKGLSLLNEVTPQRLPDPQYFYFYQGEALYFSGKKEESCELYAKAGKMGDNESQEIYRKYCLNGKERKEKKPEKRVIKMAF
jgi:tetratricopeptide (TPR) repeat protein